MHRLASMTSSGLGVVRYGYDTYGKLESIELGTYDNGNNWVLHNRYSLICDAWNRPVQTKVGTTALSTNTYDDDFRLSTVTYANGLSAHYVYDNLDRVEKIYQTEGNNTEELTYEMIYNGEGDLYEIRNYRTGRASFFDYDHAGRCMASKEREMDVDDNTGEVIGYGAILSSYGYQYDACNNLTKLTCSVLGSVWSTIYTYDDDNRPSTTTLASGKVISNTYDAIGRLTNRAIGLSTTYNTTLTYVPGDATNKTTGLVATYQNGSDDAYSYTYDDVGNITEITKGSTSISCEYDDANRLIRDNDSITNITTLYEYDAWGNILNKKLYYYTTAENLGDPVVTVPYAYSNTAWGDQLTSYDGQTITYDSMGNPTSYRGYTFAWRGKQLVGATTATHTVSFEYNEDGLRQKKTFDGLDTDYYYNGSVLIGMQRGTAKLLFSYDAAGNVISVNYNGTEYYYLRNAQGDIVKLIDGSGATVVEYTYNAWGKKVSTTGSLAGSLGLIQPFRYRGYVYDWELGLYYLQSRYYDPAVGRFISADVLLSTGQGVLGHNCYAYCLDNPVRMSDDGGCISKDSNYSHTDGKRDHFYQAGRKVYRQYLEASGHYYYDSPEKAAKAWANYFQQTNQYCECGAILFVNQEGKYRYGLTRMGSPGDSSKGTRANVARPLILGILCDRRSGEKVFGLLHTHPKYSDKLDTEFSCEDLWLTTGHYGITLEMICIAPFGGSVNDLSIHYASEGIPEYIDNNRFGICLYEEIMGYLGY